jgi:hypothetical protein
VPCRPDRLKKEEKNVGQARHKALAPSLGKKLQTREL